MKLPDPLTDFLRTISKLVNYSGLGTLPVKTVYHRIMKYIDNAIVEYNMHKGPNLYTTYEIRKAVSLYNNVLTKEQRDRFDNDYKAISRLMKTSSYDWTDRMIKGALNELTVWERKRIVIPAKKFEERLAKTRFDDIMSFIDKSIKFYRMYGGLNDYSRREYESAVEVYKLMTPKDKTDFGVRYPSAKVLITTPYNELNDTLIEQARVDVIKWNNYIDLMSSVERAIDLHRKFGGESETLMDEYRVMTKLYHELPPESRTKFDTEFFGVRMLINTLPREWTDELLEPAKFDLIRWRGKRRELKEVEVTVEPTREVVSTIVYYLKGLLDKIMTKSKNKPARRKRTPTHYDDLEFQSIKELYGALKLDERKKFDEYLKYTAEVLSKPTIYSVPPDLGYKSLTELRGASSWIREAF